VRAEPASLVAHLALLRAGAPPVLEVVEATASDRAARVAAVSPTSRLPVLVEHGTTIWETLAILEWAAERAPSLWPAHARRRAVARAVVAELHGGLGALREQLPFDWFARYRLRGEPPPAVQVDLHRLAALWGELLEDGDGFLFGPRAGLADLATVPLVGRLRTYDLWPRERAAAAYAERLLALDEVAAAFAGTAAEPARREPPALAVAVPRPAGHAPAAAREPPAAPAAPPGEAAASAAPPMRPEIAGAPSRKLEDVVARARQRDRHGPGPAARSTAPPPEPAPPEPPSPEPPPFPAPARAPTPEVPTVPDRAVEPEARDDAGRGDAAGARDETERSAAPAARGGIGWLRGGRREAPGGGRRRRPPGRR
jgi:glutathione S-transferase